MGQNLLAVARCSCRVEALGIGEENSVAVSREIGLRGRIISVSNLEDIACDRIDARERRGIAIRKSARLESDIVCEIGGDALGVVAEADV